MREDGPPPGQEARRVACCVVGAGPAGAMLALLLARQGARVALLESHTDFNREFRGDSLHPSVLDIMDEIGLVDRLFQLPHSELRYLEAKTRSGVVRFSDYRWITCKYPFEFLVAQSRFLALLVEEAKRYPNFHLLMGAQVNELITEGDVTCGVRYTGPEGSGEIAADLVVAADGRFSRLRRLAGVTPVTTTQEVDILWFRLSRKPSDPAQAFGQFGAGRILFVVDRDDYWQVGCVIRKGGYQEVRAAGLEAFRERLAVMLPAMADRVDELREWQQILTLSVASDRLDRWYKPGLLFIGDAAHVMSPVGAVGINFAIYDAVVASNRLGPSLVASKPISERDLAGVQRERDKPTRKIQDFQNFIQRVFYAPTVKNDADFDFPPIARLIFHIPYLRGGPTRLIAFGARPVHVAGARAVR